MGAVGCDWQPIETAPKAWPEMLLLYGREETHTKTETGTSISAGNWERYTWQTHQHDLADGGKP